MGVFKQMKDMKASVAAAPDMIQQANAMSAAAQQMGAAQQAAALQAQAAATGPAEGPDFEPIAGVSLAQYAEISKGLAGVGYDQSKAPDLAAAKGIVEADWNTAVGGWNARMQSNPAVAKQFNALYTGA